MIVRKRFGQHFLKDETVIARIANLVNVKPENNVIEIGPGHGAVTNFLVSSGCRLRLIEIDEDLVLNLKQRFGKHIDIITGDALKFNYSKFGKSLRVIGNLPYNISTPILFKLYEHAENIEYMTFMLQKEVVDRICARRGTNS